MKQLAYALLVGSMLVASCKGDDGEIGPQGTNGDQGQTGTPGVQGPQGLTGVSAKEKTGFIKGTIKGTKRDGTAFEETFENNYRTTAEGFYDQYGQHALSLFRSSEMGSHNQSSINLVVSNRGTNNQQVDMSSFSLNFLKNTAENKAFVMNTNANFNDISVTFPVALSNTTYDFDFEVNKEGYIRYADYVDHITNKDYQGYHNTSGDIVYFNYPQYNANTAFSEGTFAFVLKADNTKVTTGTKYDKLIIRRRLDRIIMVDEAGNDLSSTEAIPKDTYIINNFKYDSTTGIVTFDYTLNIAGLGRDNTSKNPLTITGSVESKVYDVITYKANGGSDL